MRRFAGLCLSLVLLLITPTNAQVPKTVAEAKASFAPIVKRVTPAVVNVYAARVQKGARNPLLDDPFFQHFFGIEGGQAPDRVQRSQGSGVIIDSDGLLVTNQHVIEGMTEVKVALSDKREFDADIVLRDPKSDLAVLKLRGITGLPVIALGNSDEIEVGDLVLAIGNPFGVGQTVTQGIVSALARTQMSGSDYQLYIQTDALMGVSSASTPRSSQKRGRASALVSRSRSIWSKPSLARRAKAIKPSSGPGSVPRSNRSPPTLPKALALIAPQARLSLPFRPTAAQGRLA